MKKIIFWLMLFWPATLFAAPVQTLKTPKGFTVWLVEEHALPIITMNISFTGAGLAYDPKGKEGRGNLVSSLLLEGAGERGAKEFNELLESYAIHFNIGADDDTLYVWMQTLTDNKDMAFSLLSDVLTRPRFDSDAVERARAKMQALLLEQSAAPGYKLSEAFQKNMFGDHPYAAMGFGTKASIDGLSTSDFTSYTKAYLTKDNIIISVVGDTTPEEISAIVDAKFDGLPKQYAPDVVVKDVTVPAEPNQIVVQHDMPQSMVAFGLPGIKRSDPDYIAAYVMNYMVGGNGLSSLLAKEIRVKRGLAYTVHSQLEPKAHIGIWRGMFSTRNGEVKNALAALNETLVRFSENGISEENLADAKSYLTGSFVLDLSSNQDVANFLTVMQLHKLGSDYLEKRNQLINHVTLDDIKRVSHRIIDPKHVRITIVGKPEL